MIGFDIQGAKKLFFDRHAVTSAVDRANFRNISRLVAFIKRRAQTSMRKARQKKLSEMTLEERRRYRIRQEIARREGRSGRVAKPLAHSKPGEPPRWITKLLRTHLYSIWDKGTRSGLAGPALLRGKQTSPTVPELLEYGGTVTRKGGRFRYEARPYMQPAYEKEKGKIPSLWRNSVRKAA